MLVFDTVVIDVRSRLRGLWLSVLSESFELLLKHRAAVHYGPFMDVAHCD